MTRSAVPCLDEIAATKLADFRAQALEPFLSGLIADVSDRAEAVFVYGSCLSDTTRTETSTPDFYVAVARYGLFHKKVFHALLNRVLPPNIYYFTVEGRTAKYNVISMKDLGRSVAPGAADAYNPGRFSKRLALAWASDEAVARRCARIHADAIRSMSRRAYFKFPDTFTLSDFIAESLRLSYAADVRVEAADKVDRIFQAERGYYEEAYASALFEMSGAPWRVALRDDGTYLSSPSRLFRCLGRVRLRVFLARSRILAQLRWPKGMFTVGNWLDYLIAKIERTQNIRIDLTPRQKRLWFIYGWKYFLRLRRRKLIR